MSSSPSTPVNDADIQYLPEQGLDLQAHAPRGIPCEACGTPVEVLDKFCPACGLANPHYEMPQTPAEAPRKDRPAATSVSRPPIEAEVIDAALATRVDCHNCGAHVQVPPGQRSVTCPFCDSNYVVEVKELYEGKQLPEFVIGFAITQEQALEHFRSWLGQNGWFQPGDLVTKSVTDKLKGIYLPFWSFTMLAESEYRAQIGEYWYRTETYYVTVNGKRERRTRQVRETEWYPLSGRHHKYYWGFLVTGSKGLPQFEAQRIMPFQLPALKRYDPAYLAGWMSEVYSVERDEALEIGKREFYNQEQRNVASHLPGDTHGGLEVRTSFSQINSDLCLLPVYILSYNYNGKLYRFLLNGQTGRMDGDKPISQTRIAIAVGIGVAIVAAIVLGIVILSQLM